MRKYFVLAAAVPIGLAACTTPPVVSAPAKPELMEARVSVRLVQHPSDVAKITPSYEMVAGVSRRVEDTKVAVKWKDKGEELSAQAETKTPPRGATQLFDAKPILDRIMAEAKAVHPKGEPKAVLTDSSPKVYTSPKAAKEAVSKPKAKVAAITVVLDDSVFAAGGSDLSKEALQQLDGVVEKAAHAPHMLVVAGQVADTEEKQQAMLLEKRSEAVFSYLQKKGCSIENVSRVGFAGAAATGADAPGTHRSEIIAVITRKGAE